ncbi:hypothetical protein F4778DRAFT_170768 [Xylariomycetidae sp. FL2044]|nr:hypothetical protein F4778DRAFT_170768 [Xylariomycetidae sp. FL2044]
MKSTTTFATAFLASVAVAQPHGHHHLHPKRDLVVEWETVWETATVILDDTTTQTILPTQTTAAAAASSSGSPGEFLQSPDVQTAAAAVETSSSSSSSSSSYFSSSSAAPVQDPATVYVASAEPAVATTPTTSAAPVVEPTTAYAADPTTYAAAASTTTTESAAPAETSASSGSGSSTGLDTSKVPFGMSHASEITYFDLALGACGWEDSGKGEDENLVAISKEIWDNISPLTNAGVDQPLNPLCGVYINIAASNGKTTTAKVVDRCEGCANSAIDVSRHTFTDLFGSLDGGRLDVTWSFAQG